MRKMLSAIVFVDDVDVVVFSFTEVQNWISSR